MSLAILEPAAAAPSTEKHVGTVPTAQRFHALDCVRATAMLLGVFYHLQFMSASGFGFGTMPGFFGFGMGTATNPKASVDAWLHSFRMPLFFLISGFFANMMLAKYGVWKYLLRRWWRIGAPLIVAFLVFGFLRTDFPGVTSAAFGGMALSAAPAFTPPPVAPNNNGTNRMPAGGTTNVAPFGGAVPGQFGQSPFGPPPFNQIAFGQSPFGQPPAAPPVFAAPEAPSHTWADAILNQLNRFQDWVFTQAPWMGTALTAIGGQKGRFAYGNFQFEHLWFLWYLLLFVTVAPLFTAPLGWLLRKPQPWLDRVGRWLLRFNLAALVLGLLALPAVLQGHGFDWTFENPTGFQATFPDCLVQYCSDFPLYFFYFLAGWWLFRLRDALPAVARYWLWNLSLGVAGFAISQSLYNAHGLPAGSPHFQQYRLAAFGLYAVGAACSGLGLLGFFQRYFDRPTRAGKYFTDTMLWVYLVQIAIIPHVIPWIQSDRTAWWEASLAGMAAVTAIALVTFELFIRPTPLIHLFGPASLARRANTPEAAPQ